MYRCPDGRITATCTIITPALREWARTVVRVELEAMKHAKEDPTLWRKARAEVHRRFKSSIDQSTLVVGHHEPEADQYPRFHITLPIPPGDESA